MRRPSFQLRHAVGQFESAVLHFGPRSLIHVSELGHGHVLFDVEHSPVAEMPRHSLRPDRPTERPFP